jgi:hypothetical protein
VLPPPGKGWKLTRAPDSLAVAFSHTKKGFPPISSPEATTITVYLNATTPANAARGQDSVTQDFMDQEEAQLRAGTSKSFKEDVVLKRVRRDTTTIGGYYLHLFEPTIEVTTWEGRIQSDQQLYMYFPSDFSSRGQFFLFHITKTHPPKNVFEKQGFKEILPVIESFRDERAPDLDLRALAPEPPPAP